MWSTYLGREQLELGAKDFVHQVIENPLNPRNAIIRCHIHFGSRLFFLFNNVFFFPLFPLFFPSSTLSKEVDFPMLKKHLEEKLIPKNHSKNSYS